MQVCLYAHACIHAICIFLRNSRTRPFRFSHYIFGSNFFLVLRRRLPYGSFSVCYVDNSHPPPSTHKTFPCQIIPPSFLPPRSTYFSLLSQVTYESGSKVIRKICKEDRRVLAYVYVGSMCLQLVTSTVRRSSYQLQYALPTQEITCAKHFTLIEAYW